MPAIGLALIIQIALAIHVVKTQREMYWIYIIMFIPVIGSAIYVFTQILPELQQSRTVHNATNSLIKAIDPQRELRKRKEQLQIANTLENKLKLADECSEAKMFDDAIELYQSCLKGVGEGDPNIMLKLAFAFFGKEQFQNSLETLDDLIELNPNFTSPDGHLLYARNHEMLKNDEKALEEYAVVSDNYPGEEGRVRYALLLIEKNQIEKARQVLQDSIQRSRLAPKFYQKKEKYWINLAKSTLSKLP
ncbi:MAG TPA: hypothetical protein PK055_10285 [Gammaproteobacteria bacterium]|nr:tetratricopeptide repeat protein [Xanthomonadales bacterium]MCB1593326.1 tetratricopeptide repeat protein [Xanthomonadales bacterium]HOP22878.1 hypothetical protein [Gammaproteobacteria bacterium]HPI95819.1 hypothetical protein [Gammaproteobacteria bacterium]HPQ88034.1 hypothetical protein [Gammaproteobacteria bacterium]